MTTDTGFSMPQSIEIDEKTATERYAKFTAAPFETGFGNTLGNALRRILLSSLDGIAISAVRIEGASHEFASLPAVVEDVTEIVANLKKIKFTAGEKFPKVIELVKEKAGLITGADIITSGGIEIVNPEQVICTLDKDAEFRAELELKVGRGYLPAERNKSDNHPVGTIPVDCLFSPIERVRYDVNAVRVGAKTEMDSLTLEIWSDGRIKPMDALETSSKIFKEHLKPFLGSQAGEEDALSQLDEKERKLYKVLTQNVEMMDLSVRAMNCLNNANIELIGELCLKSENRMLKYRNFGKKSLDEIKDKLEQMHLGLGMLFSDELREAVTEEAERVKIKPDEEDE